MGHKKVLLLFADGVFWWIFSSSALSVSFVGFTGELVTINGAFQHSL